MTLPKIDRSGVMPYRALRATEADAETGDDLVEHEQRARAACSGRADRRGTRPRARRAPCSRRSARRGSPRASAPCSASAASSAARSLYGHDDRVGDRCPRVTPGRTGEPEGRDAAAGLHEQRVEVAVIAARELHDLVAAGRAACEAHRGHRGFGAGRHEPHLLDRRHAVADRFRELDLARRRRAERRARPRRHAAPLRRPPGARGRGSTRPTTARSRGSRGRRCRRGMRRRGARDEERLAADRAERADRRVHAAGDARLGAREPVGHGSRVRERLGDLAGEVREDDVGAGPLDREQVLERDRGDRRSSRVARRPSPSRTRRSRGTPRPERRTRRARRRSRRGTRARASPSPCRRPRRCRARPRRAPRGRSRRPSGSRAGRRTAARTRPRRGTARTARTRTSPRRPGSPSSAWPVSSSAARIAPTWPSIIPLGATTSAPASACATAMLA